MNRLRRWLRESERTQQWLASELGVKQSTISDWINGKSSPFLENLRALARITGLTIDELVSDEPADFGSSEDSALVSTNTGTHG